MDDEGLLRGAKGDYVRRAVEASLRRLDTDWIDLLYLHMPDPDTPIDVTMQVLDDLVREGIVRFVGCSNMTAADVRAAAAASDGIHGTKFICTQDEYSLVSRDVEKELLPEIKSRDMGFFPYFPLASGLLTGKYDPSLAAPITGSRFADSPELTDRFRDAQVLEKVERMKAFAQERGKSLLELAFSWLASREGVCSIIAGATRPIQVVQNVAACGWHLSAEEVAMVDAITMIHALPEVCSGGSVPQG
jgi:aryl-alcohol dehydrogenase-like predicted oxidoreductase